MKPDNRTWLGGAGLALAFILIWSRDSQWMDAASDTLPLMMGVPLAVLFGHPWKRENQPATPLARWLAVLGAAGLSAGWLWGSLTILAFSWTLLAMLWARHSFRKESRRDRLGWLLLLSFPWMVTEWQSIGFAVRISSAAVAESLFGLLSMPVSRQGTSLSVMGVPIEIEAACAGWNLLQLTLLAGAAFGTHEIRSTRRFCIFMCLLPAITWMANLMRILLLSGVALSFDTQVAAGTVHGLTGLAILGAVLAMTKGLCVLIDPPPGESRRIVKAP